MVVDELDAGIFEYLIGEILQIISESGKGQLIFFCMILSERLKYFSACRDKRALKAELFFKISPWQKTHF